MSAVSPPSKRQRTGRRLRFENTEDEEGNTEEKKKGEDDDGGNNTEEEEKADSTPLTWMHAEYCESEGFGRLVS